QRHTSERLSQMLLQDLRLFGRGLAPQEAEQLARIDQLEDVLAKPAAERTDDEKAKIFEWYLATLDGPSKELDAKRKTLEAEEVKIKARGTVAHVMNERSEEAAAFILYRGEYDQRRDPVKAATPGVFPPMAGDSPKNRLGLARWLLAADHPMTARV